MKEKVEEACVFYHISLIFSSSSSHLHFLLLRFTFVHNCIVIYCISDSTLIEVQVIPEFVHGGHFLVLFFIIVILLSRRGFLWKGEG